MKKTQIFSQTIFAFGLAMTTNTIQGQTGINTKTPDANAALDIVSTSKGVLLPRLNSSEVTILATNNPADGMLIYNTETKCIQIYIGGSFECLTTGPQVDMTNDAWVDDTSNTMVKLGTKSDGSTRKSSAAMVVKDDGKVGIGTSKPMDKLHIEVPDASSNNLNIASFLAPNNTTAGNSSQIRLGIDNSVKNSIEYKFLYAGNNSDLNRVDISFSGDTSTPLSVLASGNVGVGTTSPQKKLHINGGMQLTGELTTGGGANTAGSAGTAGQILMSNGAENAPGWQSLGSISGTIAEAKYIQGTTQISVNSGSTKDVPGMTYTHTVPAGMKQTLLFTVVGYSGSTNTDGDQSGQGVFSLMQTVDGVTTKVSSAYASVGDIGNLINVPIPATILKSVTLNPGNYAFKVQYKAWSGNQIINRNPSGFIGFDGDNEAMLTKMQVLVYNN